MISKVCIVSSTNIKHMTLISMYTKILDEKKIEYDLIYFDKYDIEEKNNAKNTYKYTNVINREWNSFRKVREYFKFGGYAEKILKKNNYDLLIVWNTLTATILYRYLSKKRPIYILNIRDYFFEENKIFRNAHERLIKNSKFTTISSQGFKTFLPDNDYVFVNSFNDKLLTNNVIESDKSNFEVIKIGFIGNIRFIEQQKQFMNALKNDERFELWFCGTNSDLLEEFSNENNIKNVVFLGEFPPDKTTEIIQKFDIINVLFGNDNLAVKTLTPIRLYYGTFFKKPLLVNNGTFISDIVKKHNIGLNVDLLEENLSNKIYKWFMDIEWEKFNNDSEIFNKKVKEENKIFVNKFTTLLDDVIK